MKIQISIEGKNYTGNLAEPIDISIPLVEGFETVNCFYAPPYETSPVRVGDFVGSTKEGGAVNFLNIRLNPHGNGTHTECVGHIAKEQFTINQSLKQFCFPAQLMSVYPQRMENGDRVITKSQVNLLKEGIEALVIRTQPNDDWKLRTNYSGANPPYVHHEAIRYLVKKGIKHLLIDLPSIDRAEDNGKLLAHKAFWRYPNDIRRNSTITELIYVPNEIKDGLFLLNIQIAAFEIDVSPSKPVLYQLTECN